MTRNRWIAVAIGALVVVLVVGGYVAWDQLLRGDDVAALALPSPGDATSTSAAGEPDIAAPPSAAAGAGATAAPTAGSGDTAAGATADAGDAAAGGATAASLAGTWTVTDGSVAGYRVREQLGGVSALTDAVGRTSSVQGSATLAADGDQLSVTEASFTVDLTTLASDKGMRDQRLHQMGIESDRYPTATFRLTAPIAVPAEAFGGSTVDVTLTGDLTLHGVTKSVSIPAQARLAGGVIEVAGSLTFPFSDFSMTPPNVGDFVKVENDATLELLVRLAQG